MPGLATNDGSLVGRLVYGDTSIMFTGDAPQNMKGILIHWTEKVCIVIS